MKLTSSDLERVLQNAKQVHIGIIGDICLDRYIQGEMAGISREAPVPIINIDSDVYLPGGAGNTTLNARALRCEVFPISVMGDDLSADIISKELTARGISDKYLVREPGRHTQSYTKIYASSYHGQLQQVARFDQKNLKNITAESEQALLDNLHSALPDLHALILADYTEVGGIGIISEKVFKAVQKIAQEKKVIVIGDSRERVQMMQNFAAIVPNDVEVAMTLYPQDYGQRPYQDEHYAREYALELRKLTNCQYVISTRGEKGALIASADHEPVIVPTKQASGPIDVTGAGDCFAATLAACMSLKMEIVPSVELANIAAGITVKKLNTTGVATPEEIRQAFSEFCY